jgi:WD40 repeat protein
MTDQTTQDFYVQDIRKVEADAGVERIHFLGDTAVFVLGNGDLLLEPKNAAQRRLTLFEGALLSSAATTNLLVAGGDDGRVVRFSSDGEPQTIATDSERRWIDHVEVDDEGSIAWAAGKKVFRRSPSGEVCHIDIPSTVGGLAFSKPHLGIAHYNGVTLWQGDGNREHKTLSFDGMHTGITFHPEGDFVVTRMRDPVLHGWCLREGGDHVMEGYAGPVHSISWASGGNWLATSGARYLALWPIRQAQNPLSNVPILLAGYRSISTAVACHPSYGVVAVGYADGAVLLIRIEDEAEILLKNATGVAVSSIVWSATGSEVAIGCKDGTGRVIYFS